MFQRDYLQELIRIGAMDAESRWEEIARLIAGPRPVEDAAAAAANLTP